MKRRKSSDQSRNQTKFLMFSLQKSVAGRGCGRECEYHLLGVQLT